MELTPEERDAFRKRRAYECLRGAEVAAREAGLDRLCHEIKGLVERAAEAMRAAEAGVYGEGLQG